MEQNQRYQKLQPVGRIYSQGVEYWLLKPEPEPIHGFIDNLGCWEFMVVPDSHLVNSENELVKSGENLIYPSPRLIVVTDFLIEWGSEQPILCMPTEYEDAYAR